jgi:ribosomal protein S18 acetylase RimI-like enzyme
LETYEGTLDCPEVNGVRELDEIITGHRSQGTHDPARWRLVSDENGPVGVLLLAEIPEWNSLDVSYLGVVPGQRRRGIGKDMMRWSLGEALAAGCSQVTLSVDERNRPAWSLYRELGFDSYDRREVYLAIWNREITPTITICATEATFELSTDHGGAASRR